MEYYSKLLLWTERYILLPCILFKNEIKVSDSANGTNNCIDDMDLRVMILSNAEWHENVILLLSCDNGCPDMYVYMYLCIYIYIYIYQSRMVYVHPICIM